MQNYIPGRRPTAIRIKLYRAVRRIWFVTKLELIRLIPMDYMINIMVKKG